MRAMVLAAGLGTRLRPVTETLPKCLVPVGGRPMIDYALLLLRHYGIREIIVNIHHLGQQVEAYLGNGGRFDLDVCYSREEVLLDTGGGLLGARTFLEHETFVVINGDVLIDLNLDDVIRAHRNTNALATLVLRRDAMAEQYGAIATNLRGRIQKFLNHERPGAASESIETYMFTGVHVIEPTIFDYMEDDAPFSITRVTYPRLLRAGAPLYGFTFDGKWQDLGTPERLREADVDMRVRHWKPHYL